jgi:NADP-dependent 3-hydroxy acid dehydrogenase YdfG
MAGNLTLPAVRSISAMPTDMTSGFDQGMAQPDGTVRPEPKIAVDDVARAVLYMAGLPLSANVLTMTVMATKMPYVGRG